MDARTILSRKGHTVFTVSPSATIREAMALLIRHGVSSLIVIGQDDEVVGIITERDIFRLTYEHDGRIMELPVKSVMTRELIIALPYDKLDYLKSLITENRIRHLPVIDQGKLAGIVSIGDIVREESSAVAVENRYLKDFIFGPTATM
ncbi:MAG: CBS domain-containing protein [bacterium]|nr:CBS domain-containing protein [bacterium]